MDVSIVIPAYNEENRLGPTLRDAADYFASTGRTFEIIVVDDGSRDGTSELVRSLMPEMPSLRLIRLAANRGKGHAVRTGVVNSAGRLVLFADADGATPFPEFQRLERAIAGGADVAIGSRAVRGEEVEVRAKLYRRIIGRAFHLLVSTLTVKGFEDTQCGFKLFRSAVAHDLFSRLRMDGFVFDVEVLLMARRGGYEVDEIPVNWEHQPGSRVNLALDSLRMARDLFIIRAHILRGHYDQPHIASLGSVERRGDADEDARVVKREARKAAGLRGGA
ncbi:MAG: glycosyltransferase family 2 protein [Gemmatimonadota bacterium]|jgi:dolichyl-phosphate beta-glucosyltransferase